MTLELVDKEKMVIHFLLFCIKKIIFETIIWIVITQNLVLDRFSMEVLLIAPVIARTALYGIFYNPDDRNY